MTCFNPSDAISNLIADKIKFFFKTFILNQDAIHCFTHFTV